MSTNAIATVTKMLEVLPDHVQDRVVNQMREYIEESHDDLEWD